VFINRIDCDNRAALIVGAPLTAAFLGAYGVSLAARGRPDVLRSLLYNGPIAFLFLVLGAQLALLGWDRRLTGVIRSYGPTLASWLIAAVLLVLRLGPNSIEVSGHMAWLPLLTADAWVRGFPLWFVAFGMAATTASVYLKIGVFGGPSAVPGVLAGACLAGLLLLWSQPRHEKAGQAGLQA
jgi:hypothetical protein